jgi:hypothetical protein
MTKRTTKQLIIALIFLFILSGIGFLIYYFNRPAPSCFDGVQNQGEEGIDCGGPCPSCELVALEQIKVLWIKAIPAQGNFYDLAAQIKNPNQNYGSGQVPYQFELYDAQDNLIAEYTGLTFILPNQTKYLLQTKAESSRPVSKVKLSFAEIEWQKIEDYQPPQLVIQQKEYRLLGSEEPGFSQTRGVLINKTNFDFDKIDIDILLFDSAHHLLAVGTTEIRTLLAGQERDFVATWFRKINGQVAFIEMEAETNIFDVDNYLPAGQQGLPAGRGVPERFQEY